MCINVYGTMKFRYCPLACYRQNIVTCHVWTVWFLIGRDTLPKLGAALAMDKPRRTYFWLQENSVALRVVCADVRAYLELHCRHSIYFPLQRDVCCATVWLSDRGRSGVSLFTWHTSHITYAI